MDISQAHHGNYKTPASSSTVQRWHWSAGLLGRISKKAMSETGKRKTQIENNWAKVFWTDQSKLRMFRSYRTCVIVEQIKRCFRRALHYLSCMVKKVCLAILCFWFSGKFVLRILKQGRPSPIFAMLCHTLRTSWLEPISSYNRTMTQNYARLIKGKRQSVNLMSNSQNSTVTSTLARWPHRIKMLKHPSHLTI